MVELPTMSPIQFRHTGDGRVELAGRPDVVITGNLSTSFPEWEHTLGLPVYQEEWEALAEPRGLSGRMVRFLVQPFGIRFQSDRLYRFTLGHTGFVIGLCEVRQQGECLVGDAILYDSPLADIAWHGIQHAIFTHSCSVLADGNTLIEVALTTQEEAVYSDATLEEV